MVKIIWTERSVTDLKDIAEYIGKDSVRYAKLTIDKIIDKTSILEKQPLIGRIVPEINDKNIRELIIGNYRIIYEHHKLYVNILTVHHSKRDLKKRDLNTNKD